MAHNRIILSLAALLVAAAACTPAHRLDIDLETPGAAVQPTMYGIFFEDINFAADGGLYAELVKNRSFEFPEDPLQGWKAFGKVEVRSDGPFDRCPHYVRLYDPGHKEKWTGLDNEGFFGIGVKGGETYRFTVWARVPDGGESALRIELVNTASMGEDQHVCRETLDVTGREWKQYEVILQPEETLEKGVLRIFLRGDRRTVDLEHVSLFPTDTWMGHRNGMRKDLAQALADLHPGVFRFPGGCIVEGTDLATRYNWKNTVGPVENRPLNENRWEYTFTNRFFPDYFQSYGLGFFEFFQLAEEIGAAPLPILSCGLACQFQNEDEAAHCPVDKLQPFIQDALDLIEFANGPVTSTWGKVRAEMGHPEPFGLQFIGIGNEQWGPEYPEHLEPFVEAIRTAYPDIRIVGSSGPNSEGDEFDYLWPEMKRLGADLVDEHFYRPETWFLAQGARYDDYDREGPKVFAGEYACHGDGRKYNHFNASLLEAAFMTTIERNADLVHMATYAPLFAHVEGWQWRPDLIWYDNLRSMRTASWHVQNLYSTYKGQNVLTLKMNGANVTGAEGQDGLFASAVLDGNKVYVKVINTSEKPQSVELAFGETSVQAVERIDFTSSLLYEDNTLDEPDRIAPVKSPLNGFGQAISATVEPLCFSIFVFEK
jgi:alpha-L-arabinofuranosidase